MWSRIVSVCIVTESLFLNIIQFFGCSLHKWWKKICYVQVQHRNRQTHVSVSHAQAQTMLNIDDAIVFILADIVLCILCVCV